LSQPRSDWLFLILRGLALLVLGWALGALYGLTSLGFVAVFLPISGTLLGFSPQRATAAGWMTTLCACVGALLTFSQELSFQSLILFCGEPTSWGDWWAMRYSPVGGASPCRHICSCC
jgi:hypothetical protein